MKQNIVTKTGYESLSEEDLIKELKNNIRLIHFIKNPSEQIQLTAVSQNGLSIVLFENPSEKVQIAAIENNPIAIRYIEKPNQDIQLEAITRNHHVCNLINGMTKQTKRLALNIEKQIKKSK